jgi:hypothetical protein
MAAWGLAINLDEGTPGYGHMLQILSRKGAGKGGAREKNAVADDDWAGARSRIGVGMPGHHEFGRGRLQHHRAADDFDLVDVAVGLEGDEQDDVALDACRVRDVWVAGCSGFGHGAQAAGLLLLREGGGGEREEEEEESHADTVLACRSAPG